jgi:hypothetical protein
MCVRPREEAKTACPVYLCISNINPAQFSVPPNSQHVARLQTNNFEHPNLQSLKLSAKAHHGLTMTTRPQTRHTHPKICTANKLPAPIPASSCWTTAATVPSSCCCAAAAACLTRTPHSC